MKKERNSTIDLLRIIAIFLVISCHIALPPIRETGEIDLGRLIISCLVGDGVAIFWIVSGFFIFREEAYSKKILKVIKTIIIPSFLLIVFTVIFYRFIINEKSLTYCLLHLHDLKDAVKETIIGILGLDASKILGAQHLWYVFSYMVCYLWVPLLSFLFVKGNKTSKLAKYMVIILGLLSLLLASVSEIYGTPFSYIKPITIVSPALLLLIIGKIIYDNLEKIKNNKTIRYVGIIVFVLISILKIRLQYVTYYNEVANPYFLYWNTLPAIIESIGLILFILSFDIKNSRIINHFGKLAFGMYLLHWMIKEKLKYNGFFDELYNKLNVNSSSLVCEIAYTLVVAFIVFLLTLILVEIIKAIKHIIGKWFCAKNKTVDNK